MIIRKAQINAFKTPVRKKNRDQMLLQLQAKGYKVSDEGNRDIAIVDSKGNKTRLIFDENYIARKIIKPSGLEYSFEFDDDDNLSKLVFPGNEFMGMGYEKDLLKSLSLNHKRILLHYDTKNRLCEIVTPDGKRNSITYNISNQVETLTNRAGETKRFETNIKDNRLLYSLKDSLGRVTKIDTDPLGSGDEIIFADGSRETTVYDEDLDALVTTLRNGSKKVTYYEENSPSRVEWEDGNFVNLELDEQQQIKQLDNPTGTVSFEYDEKGRILEEAFQGNKVSYVYDDDGLLTQMVYPSGLVVAYDYDEDGRLKSINAGGHACTYSYGDNDTISEVRYPNGIQEQRKQQVLGGITESVLLDATGQTISRQSYRYDNLNRLTQYRSTDKNRLHKEKSWELSYDAEDRLLSNTETQSGKTERFEYDRKGNLSSVNGSTVQVGPMDEILSIEGSEIKYDRNGNVKSFIDHIGNNLDLSYNDDGCLASVSINRAITYYWYDALGRRIAKTDGTTSSLFYWAGERLIGEKYTQNGSLVFRQYVYNLNENMPWGYIENKNFFCLHKDVRGAVINVTDKDSSIRWSASYNSFGNCEVNINEIYQPWRLMGHYHDFETGLNYNLGRYYSDSLRSFLSVDPLWFENGATNYSYCANDPYNKADYTGRLWHIVAAVTVGAVVGGIIGGVSEGSWEAAAKGAAKGALTGLGAALGGFAGFAAASATIAFLENILDQSKQKDEICISCALVAAGGDLALNMVTAGVSKYVSLKVLQGLKQKINVTSWADAHIPKDQIKLVKGKWVMLGPKTKGNHLMSGTVGFKANNFKELFTPWKWKKVNTPYDNANSGLIDARKVGLPQNVPTAEKIKAFLFQQYQIIE